MRPSSGKQFRCRQRRYSGRAPPLSRNIHCNPRPKLAAQVEALHPFKYQVCNKGTFSYRSPNSHNILYPNLGTVPPPAHSTSTLHSSPTIKRKTSSPTAILLILILLVLFGKPPAPSPHVIMCGACTISFGRCATALRPAAQRWCNQWSSQLTFYTCQVFGLGALYFIPSASCDDCSLTKIRYYIILYWNEMPDEP
jgi:hypothetical protein